MLRLAIKPREEVYIGHEIIITNEGQHTIKVGFQAPGHVLIKRAKLLEPTTEGTSK